MAKQLESCALWRLAVAARLAVASTLTAFVSHLVRHCLRRRQVPVIRRFTGGGTVVTDAGTMFVSFIFNKVSVRLEWKDCYSCPKRRVTIASVLVVPVHMQGDVTGQPLYPREVMNWSAQLYTPVFERLVSTGTTFNLQEHDYCLDDRKFGGNAQSISRDRWVHHTSFLWDFDPKNMDLLRIPEKRPDYRRDRKHSDFLTPLSEHFGSHQRSNFEECLLERLECTMEVKEVTLEEANEVLLRPQERKTNIFLDL